MNGESSIWYGLEMCCPTCLSPYDISVALKDKFGLMTLTCSNPDCGGHITEVWK